MAIHNLFLPPFSYIQKMKNNTLFSLSFILFSTFIFNSCVESKKPEVDKKASTLENNVSDTGILPIEKFEMNCSIRAIEVIDDNSLWYAGSRGQYGYTEDSGKTWTIDSLNHLAVDNLEFRSIAITQKSVFLLSIASPVLLYKSDDKGKNWRIVYQENDSLAFYDSIAFWDNDTGIAMGDPTDGCLSIIKSIDGGNNWKKISCDVLPESASGEAAFAASNSNISLYGNNVWIVSGGMKSRVLHSPDRGETWAVYETPIVQGRQMTGIFSCDFFDEKTGIVFGGDWEDQNSNIKNKAITQDGGKTWSLIADGKKPGFRSCIRFLEENSFLPIIAVGIPGISISNDGGMNWKDVSQESYYTVRKGKEMLWLAGKDKIARLPLDVLYNAN